MSSDKTRQIAEALQKAKSALLDALRLAEEVDKTLARSIGSMAGRIETLQYKHKTKHKL